jgi:hypothetical protein
MIVTNLNIVSVTVVKPETDTPWGIDRNRVLTGTVAHEGMKLGAGWGFKVLCGIGGVKLVKLTYGTPGDIRWKPTRLAISVKFFCALIGKRLNHTWSVMRHVTHVNRGNILNA